MADAPFLYQIHAGRLIRREYGISNYHRRFRLDDAVDPERIAASCRDGVLHVDLPKREAAQRRTITISTDD